MRIPANKLLEYIEPGMELPLRTATFMPAHSALPYTDVLAYVYRNVVEGVATASGKIRYLRLLSAEELRAMAADTEDAQEEQHRATAASSVIAQVRIGAYRQRLNEAVVVERLGHRVVVAEGELNGYCWTHCGRSNL
jgi:acetyl-CoA carboxylase beta subunit